MDKLSPEQRNALTTFVKQVRELLRMCTHGGVSLEAYQFIEQNLTSGQLRKMCQLFQEPDDLTVSGYRGPVRFPGSVVDDCNPFIRELTFPWIPYSLHEASPSDVAFLTPEQEHNRAFAFRMLKNYVGVLEGILQSADTSGSSEASKTKPDLPSRLSENYRAAFESPEAQAARRESLEIIREARRAADERWQRKFGRDFPGSISELSELLAASGVSIESLVDEKSAIMKADAGELVRLLEAKMEGLSAAKCPPANEQKTATVLDNKQNLNGLFTPMSVETVAMFAEHAFQFAKAVREWLPVKGDAPGKVHNSKTADRWFDFAARHYIDCERIRNPLKLPFNQRGGSYYGPADASPFWLEICYALDSMADLYRWQGLSDETSVPCSSIWQGSLPSVDAGTLARLERGAAGLKDIIKGPDLPAEISFVEHFARGNSKAITARTEWGLPPEWQGVVLWLKDRYCSDDVGTLRMFRESEAAASFPELRNLGALWALLETSGTIGPKRHGSFTMDLPDTDTADEQWTLPSAVDVRDIKPNIVRFASEAVVEMRTIIPAAKETAALNVSRTLADVLGWATYADPNPLSMGWWDTHKANVEQVVRSATRSFHDEPEALQKLGETRSLAVKFLGLLYHNPTLSKVPVQDWTVKAYQRLFDDLSELEREFRIRGNEQFPRAGIGRDQEKVVPSESNGESNGSSDVETTIASLAGMPKRLSHFRQPKEWLILREQKGLSCSKNVWPELRKRHGAEIDCASTKSARISYELAQEWGLDLPEFREPKPANSQKR